MAGLPYLRINVSKLKLFFCKESDIIADTFVHELPTVFTRPYVELVFQTNGIEVFAVLFVRPEPYNPGYELQRTFKKSCEAAYGIDMKPSPESDLLQLSKAAVASGKELPKFLLTCGTEDFLFHVSKAFLPVFQLLQVLLPSQHECTRGLGRSSWGKKTLRDVIFSNV